MTRHSAALIAAGVVAGVLLVQGLIVGAWNIVFGYVSLGGALSGLFANSNLYWAMLMGVLRDAAFAAGVYGAIRYLKPVRAGDAWRSVLTSGLLATVAGTAGVLVVGGISSLIAAFTIGAYPFGYSLDAAVDPEKIQWGFQAVVAGAITPLIVWLPLAVLACVVLKLWLVAHPETPDVRDRASVSA